MDDGEVSVHGIAFCGVAIACFCGSGLVAVSCVRQWGQVILRRRLGLVVDDLPIEVQGDGQSRWWRTHVDVFPQELPVPDRDPTRPVHPDHVLVKLPHFDD